jgi:hypothetical protein
MMIEVTPRTENSYIRKMVAVGWDRKKDKKKNFCTVSLSSRKWSAELPK